MPDKLAEARRSLVKAKQSAEAKLTQLETERQTTKASIKSLEAAIRALDGPKRSSNARAESGSPPSE